MATQSEIIEQIRKLSPVLGEKEAKKLEIAFFLENYEGKRRIWEILDAVKAFVSKNLNLDGDILMKPPNAEIASKGEIMLGNVLYGGKALYPMFLEKNVFLSHVGIFGSSGYGKTNLAKHLVIQLSKLNVPIIIFDFSKRNYRSLAKLPELKDRIRIYTVGRDVSPITFNPLKPPEGITISQWSKEFAEVFDHAYWLMGGGKYIILKALDAVYSKYENPTIVHVKEWVEAFLRASSSARERNWAATACRPLESLCFRDTRIIFDTARGISPSEFFKEGEITILELDGLATEDKVFFIEVMLQWIRDWLLTAKKSNELRGVILLEEAHYLLNREKNKRAGSESVMDLVFREIRELGVGIIYIDQHPSLVSFPALGNTSTHVYFNLGLDTKQASDIEDAAHMLGLKEEERDYLRRLPVGQAFVRSRKSDFPFPFLMSFPVVVNADVSDEEVRELMKAYLIEKIKEEQMQEIELDDNEWKILKIIGSFQANKTKEIYMLAKMSGSTFKKVVDRLIEDGLVIKVKGYVHDKRAWFYFLSEKGRKLFEEKFGKLEIKKVEENLEELKTACINYFTLKGWQVVKNEERSVTFLKEGEFMTAVVGDLNERKIVGKIGKKVVVTENKSRAEKAIAMGLGVFLPNAEVFIKQ